MSGEWTDCSVCGVMHGVPFGYLARRREDGQTFYCPNGHTQVFRTTDKQRLEAEVSRLKQRMAEKDDEAAKLRDQIAHQEARARGFQGVIAKQKKRAAAGVCPCCTRHFTNLERHMKGRHPDYAASGVEPSP